MIQTADLERAIALALASSYVKGEKPVSLLIVSDRPEAGKSDVLSKFSKSSKIAYLTDATAYALWRDFHQVIARGEVRHMLIPEFLLPLSRSSDTVKSFITTLQALIEEGFAEIHTGFLKPIKFQSAVSVGVLACMPRPAFLKYKPEWELSGFLSRFMVVTYSYDAKTVEEIFQSIINRAYLTEVDITLDFPEESMDITIPETVAQKCLKLALYVTETARSKGKAYGFRELKNIQRMVAANVILDNMKHRESVRTIADLYDFAMVMRLRYLFTEDFNPLQGSTDWASLENKIHHVRQGLLLLPEDIKSVISAISGMFPDDDGNEDESILAEIEHIAQIIEAKE